MQAVRGIRRVAVVAPRMTRSMGGGGHGHGHAKPTYTGAEAVARRFLPENEHMVYGILGLYAVIGFLGTRRSASTKASAVAALPTPEKPDFTTPIAKSSDIPAMSEDAPAWEAFVAAAPENFEKWLTGGEEGAPAAAH